MNEKKRVPLFLGEGPERVEVGVGEVELTDDGAAVLYHVSITDQNVSKMFQNPKENPLMRYRPYSVGPAEGGLGKMETS